MATHTSLLAIIVLAPLAGAALIGILGKRWNERLIGIVACSTVGLSTVLAFIAFFGQLMPLAGDAAQPRLLTQYLFTWIKVGNFQSDFAFMLDPLSGIMVVFVTFVALLIHIFATGYMHGEDGYYRFFAYLNLFMFAMLTLILGDNLLMLFVGWEGVGLCSYLLVGYYYLKTFAGDAAKKAFVVNRIGDVGFGLGIMLIYKTFGTISFNPAFAGGSFIAKAHAMAIDPFGWGLLLGGGLTCIAFLLFIGAVGKSAQIPLFVWLPDAMAGPTPVSALIHAATMVTAGVYMVTRTSEIYAHAPTAMFLVAIIGAVTAIFAATIGLGQWDIKKVLAYSTVSQLGYMFLACGVGAWGFAIFHVFTHAFFKAQLFLGSGSVIHGMHHEQDMRKMGGLRKYMPITCYTMAVSLLAISGFPGFSGFFSKDGILFSAFSTKSLPDPAGKVLWVLGAITALLTAIYMTRLMVLTFLGEERFKKAPETIKASHGSHNGNGHHAITPHESPLSMTLPLVVLAVGALTVGFLGVPKVLGGADRFEHFLAPVVATAPTYGSQVSTESHTGHVAAAHETETEDSAGRTEEWVLMGVSVLIALAGLAIGWFWFSKKPLWQPPSILENKYYVDEIYDATVVNPIKTVSASFLWRFFDVLVIDGLVNYFGTIVRDMGSTLRMLQTGVIRNYAAIIAIGGLIIIGYIGHPFIWDTIKATFWR